MVDWVDVGFACIVGVLRLCLGLGFDWLLWFVALFVVAVGMRLVEEDFLV